jgi:hypothetical protein
LICAVCGRDNEVARGAFGRVCDGCGAFLHSCFQCRLYCGSSRGCASSTTEEQGDPSHKNFCEEFEPLGSKRDGPARQANPGGSASRFDDLFGGGKGQGS